QVLIGYRGGIASGISSHSLPERGIAVIDLRNPGENAREDIGRVVESILHRDVKLLVLCNGTERERPVRSSVIWQHAEDTFILNLARLAGYRDFRIRIRRLDHLRRTCALRR